MYDSLFIVGIICAVLAGAFLIATAAMFFGFNIPLLMKDLSGALEQKQIEEIRKNSSNAANKRSKVNVFEELEKRAKVKKNNTHSLNVGPTTDFMTNTGKDAGTSLLRSNAKSANPNFVIEKNIMFVSTNDVI